MRNNDDGAAVVEFILLSLLLLVPVVYLVLTLAQVQSAAFASEAIARDVSRAVVVGGVDALQTGASHADAERAGRHRAEAVLATTLADFGLADVEVEISCTSSPCLEPGSEVEASVRAGISLPGIGALIPGARVTVESLGASPIDGYVP